MKAKTFDRKFDSGEKIVDQLDLSKARRVGTDAKRVKGSRFRKTNRSVRVIKPVWYSDLTVAHSWGRTFS
jgi:hypothetical protein